MVDMDGVVGTLKDESAEEADVGVAEHLRYLQEHEMGDSWDMVTENPGVIEFVYDQDNRIAISTEDEVYDGTTKSLPLEGAVEANKLLRYLDKELGYSEDSRVRG